MLPTASRKATPSPRLRYSQLSLLVSALAAVLAGFGFSLWVTLAALVVSVGCAVVATVLAWREAKAVQAAASAQQAAEARGAAELFRQANVRQRQVVGLLSARNTELSHQVGAARAESAEVTQLAGQLRGDKAALQQELVQRTNEVAAMKLSLARAQAALDEKVVPIRLAGEQDEPVEVWTEDGYPTLVQLDVLAQLPPAIIDERKHA